MTNSNLKNSSTERAADIAQAASFRLDVPQQLLHIPIAGAMYLETMGAPSPEVWWPVDTTGDEVAAWLTRQHCELSVSVSFALSLARLFGRPPRLDWQLEFDIAYLFF